MRAQHQIETDAKGDDLSGGAPDYKQDYAVNAYQSFKAYYNLKSDHAPPLVVIDLEADGTAPFALHPMLADFANSIPY